MTTTASQTAAGLLRRYRRVRAQTQELCRPLSAEDCQVQSMPDASPVKWHLAHTTWFFETFVLAPHCQGYAAFHPRYGFLFNSYYNAVGERVARPNRGLLSRPSLEEVFSYRHAVDTRLRDFLEEADEGLLARVAAAVELGLHHEQQHQELILTDVKHALWTNPLRPAYRRHTMEGGTAAALDWATFPAGVRWVGHGGAGFAYDNEAPRHRVFVDGFRLATRPVTCGEWLAFMADGGYRRPDLWMSDGWAECRSQGWDAPLYWETVDRAWWLFTFDGLRPVDVHEPVCHVSWYEADAYARWAGARLPTEAEWEAAAADAAPAGNLLDGGRLHPAAGAADNGLAQLFGDVWEWTASPYAAYPGYRPPAGALGEYNGKFMCNQMVLRGGSCATPATHIRATYRNFFPPNARWQFSGVRLGGDV